eukprot:TRINITY_DN14626_c0_g1_i1.p1 TRINITY_DN14626_c0_g1~~TRINITY_DN14626_c0_g1_i1.p1  ORF type:complete len:435 (+),score=48.56 TRINITY_DN14626_c0_g1_i1:83-1387(+)
MSSAAEVLRWLFVDHFNNYEKWPWAYINSFERQVAEHPSFIFVELTSIGFAALSLYHALTTKDPDGSRRLPLIWIATILVGILNDYIFMLLPIVDNFWQAQAIFMLTPRMCLYIPCIYNLLLYWPTVAAARIFRHGVHGRNRFAEASLAAVLCGVFYAPYDVCGARFLWWTWHESDSGVLLRWLGVPAGSTVWTITFAYSFAYLQRTASNLGYDNLRTLGLLGLTTPMMMGVINVFTLLGLGYPGKPGVGSVVTSVIVFGAVVYQGLVKPQSQEGEEESGSALEAEPRVVRGAFLGWFSMLIFVMTFFSPETQVSTGVHQEFGPCDILDIDLIGFPRSRYICRERYPSSYFTFDCPSAAQSNDAQPASGRWMRLSPELSRGTHGEPVASWYTVCGVPHESWAKWMLGVTTLGVAGSVSFLWALGDSALQKSKVA